MGLFFGNNDVKVAIQKAAKLTLGKLDKMLIITNEADIPAMALSGSDGVSELKTYLDTNTKTAPKLIEAVTIALGQEDNSGNKLIPAYLFVLGKKIADGGDMTALYTMVEEFDKTKEADFWGITTIAEDAKFEEWAQTYTPNHIYATFTTKARALTDKGKSGRTFGQKMESEGYNHVAWMSRIIFPGELISAKFKKLNGCTADPLTDGEVELMTKAGWNGYRTVRGKGQTTGSICTDATTHIDETYTRDTIIYNVANSLMDMFDTEEIVPMGYDGKKLITGYLNTALMYCGELGLIERGEDGGYLFEVNVPEFTTAMKSLRELSSSTPLFTYSPNIPLEKIDVTGKEILEWVGGAA